MIIGSPGVLYLPIGYQSGTALNNTMTFPGATFAGLGLAPGTYNYTWGTGDHADRLTISAVPEPSAWTLLGVGFVGLGVLVSRRRMAVRRTQAFARNEFRRPAGR